MTIRASDMEEALRRLDQFADVQVQVEIPPEGDDTERWLEEIAARGLRAGQSPQMARAIRNLGLSAGISDEVARMLHRWTDDYALPEIGDPRAIFTAGVELGAILVLTAEQLSRERRNTSSD
jgi:hypothetical protein